LAKKTGTQNHTVLFSSFVTVSNHQAEFFIKQKVLPAMMNAWTCNPVRDAKL